MAVQTGKVKGRRQLEFNSYEQILDEARRLASGPTRCLGNWSLGQNLRHLAAGMDMALDGPPFKAPFLIRLVGPLLKKRFLTRPMQSGFQLPSTATKLLPPETSSEEGLALLEHAVARLRATSARKPHGVFGTLTNAEWDQLQFRHCAMHLSFIESQ
jgi:hypothetical protein